MKAVIMAGGKGTRLRPLTCNMPKPMVPLLDRPVMEYTVDLLKRHGMTDIAVTMQFLPDVIRQHFGDGSEFGVRIHYTEENQPLGTAGSVKLAEAYLDETFVVISGDALTDFNLSDAIAFHKRRGAAATLVLTRVDTPLDFGVVMTDGEGDIIRFLEKPSWGEVFSDTVNTGIYILEPSVLKYFESGREFDFSKDLFPLLMQSGERLCGYVASGYWSDIGNLQQYRQSQFDMLEGKVDVDIRGTERLPRVWVGERARIADDFTAEGPAFIGDDCSVEAGANIGHFTVVGKGSLIKRGAGLERAVLWSHSAIEPFAEVKGATVCRNVVVGEHAQVHEGAVLGDRCAIGGKAVIQSGVSLWPGKSVEPYARVNQSIILGEKRARSLFGDGGIKGMASGELTPLFAAKLALAYATTLPAGGSVTIGCDASPYAAILAGALSSGLQASGIHTLELGTVTAPVSRHATYHAACAGGIHVRSAADTQAGQYALEFWDAGGLPIDKSAERKIENAFVQEDSRKVSLFEMGRATHDRDAVGCYRRDLLAMAEPHAVRAKEYSVVIAYDYGNLKGLIPELLEELGCSIIQLYAKSNTRTIGEMVRLSGADIGVRLDANGQLTALADETGEPVPDNVLSVLKLLVQLDSAPDVMHVPVNVPDVVAELGRQHGIHIVRTKADFRSRMAALHKDGFHPTYDGLSTLVHLLRAMATRNRKLSDLLLAIPAFALHQMTVDCPWQDKGKIMRCLMEETRGAQIELIDGIKIYHPGGWTLIRPDGDEPYVRILVQAATVDAAESIAASYAGKIESFRVRAIV